MNLSIYAISQSLILSVSHSISQYYILSVQNHNLSIVEFIHSFNQSFIHSFIFKYPPTHSLTHAIKKYIIQNRGRVTSLTGQTPTGWRHRGAVQTATAAPNTLWQFLNICFGWEMVWSTETCGGEMRNWGWMMMSGISQVQWETHQDQDRSEQKKQKGKLKLSIFMEMFD